MFSLQILLGLLCDQEDGELEARGESQSEGRRQITFYLLSKGHNTSTFWLEELKISIS